MDKQVCQNNSLPAEIYERPTGKNNNRIRLRDLKSCTLRLKDNTLLECVFKLRVFAKAFVYTWLSKCLEEQEICGIIVRKIVTYMGELQVQMRNEMHM